MMTIAAISTPPGTGGIAIIRLSGSDAFKIADKIWEGASLSDAPSHTAHLGRIVDSDGDMLDEAVATVFAEGKSFTGEPTVEFSVHGSKWIQKRVVERLVEEGASVAEPGEFTRRAFINGRIDLAQAEAIADMIAASSKAAQRLAATQMKGAFSKRLNSLRDKMIDLASLLELELDFSEEDVEFADRGKLIDLTREAREEIKRLADSFRTGKALKEGIAVVIAGPPNAGKSTLLNHLLQDDKAIVSDIAGTTRDIIEDTAEINGILFRFIDTAGIRVTTDDIERIGVDRARRAADNADILLWLTPADSPASSQSDASPSAPSLPEESSPSTLSEEFPSASSLPEDPSYAPTLSEDSSSVASLPEESSTVSSISDASMIHQYSVRFESVSDSSSSARSCSVQKRSFCSSSIPTLHLLTKSDLLSSESSNKSEEQGADFIKISAKTGAGIPELIERLTALASDGRDPAADLVVTNARHYEALSRAAEALDRVDQALCTGLPADLTAQDLREAIHHLGAITGAITTTDLLQTIFSRFCIGK